MKNITNLLFGLTVGAAALGGPLDIERGKQFNDSAGKPVNLTIVSAQANRVRLKMLYPPEHASPSAVEAGPRGTLRELSATNEFAGPRNLPRFILSGTSNGYRHDVPAALLITEGAVKSAIDSSPPGDPAGATCKLAAESKYQYSGILCGADADQGWRILETAQYQPRMCRNALQSGPMLIEKSGEVGICPVARTGAKPTNRMAVCLDAARTMHFVYSDPVELYALAKWLKDGPLQCKMAIAAIRWRHRSPTVLSNLLGGKVRRPSPIQTSLLRSVHPSTNATCW
jgi:hypothetical protein